jgi:hypothetical protein
VDANTRAVPTAPVDRGSTLPDPLPRRQVLLILLPYLALAVVIVWLMMA